MRPAEVCGCWTKPSSSSLARMLRTVADDTPSPAAATSNDDATGSPDAMYSRTSASSTRFDRSWGSTLIVGTVGATVGNLGLRLPNHYSKSETGTVREATRFSSRRRSQLAEIDAFGRRVVDEDRPVDDRRPDVGAARGIHQCRVRIARRNEWQPISIDDDEVGALAGLDRSDVGVEPERPSTFASGHRQGVARGQRPWRAARRLEECGK